MALRRQNSRWNPWCFVATLLLLAVAAIGVGGTHLSGARAQPAALVDLLKKKAAAKGKPAIAAKKGLPGKGVSKGAPGGTKNAISKGGEATAKSKSVLGKGTETPGAKGLTKGGAPKNAANANLSKGA